MLFSINSVPKICAPNLCTILCPICAPFGAHGVHSFVPNLPWRHFISHFCHVTCVVILPWHSPWRNGKCHGIITTQVTWQMPKYCYNTSAMAPWQMPWHCYNTSTMAKIRIVLQHKGHGNIAIGAQKLYASCAPNGAQIGH